MSAQFVAQRSASAKSFEARASLRGLDQAVNLRFVESRPSGRHAAQSARLAQQPSIVRRP